MRGYVCTVKFQRQILPASPLESCLTRPVLASDLSPVSIFSRDQVMRGLASWSGCNGRMIGYETVTEIELVGLCPSDGKAVLEQCCKRASLENMCCDLNALNLPGGIIRCFNRLVGLHHSLPQPRCRFGL